MIAFIHNPILYRESAAGLVLLSQSLAFKANTDILFLYHMFYDSNIIAKEGPIYLIFQSKGQGDFYIWSFVGFETKSLDRYILI